jgi:hypothetical protein
MPRNAFLTYGVGYHANIIQPVANSFQRYTTAQDDIIYFVKASLLEEIRSALAVMRPENFHLVACPAELEPDEYYVNRWTALTEWASANHHRYKSILVTDARDLIFQDNPFNPLAPADFSHQMLKIDLESLTDDCESYSTNKKKK